MCKWKSLTGVVLLAMTVTLSAGAFSTATAAHASRRALQAVTLSNKVILPETSIDGPAFFSQTDTFEGVHSHTVIAWTGTDPLHHLNLLTSTDQPPKQLHFGNKLTLSETSPFRPAVLQLSGGIGNAVIIAWTGTDPNHSLNVLVDPYRTQGSVPRKLTLWNEFSLSAPGLTFFNSQVLLAWTGIDPNHSLNILPLGIGGLTPGTKTILPQFGSSVGPNLATFPTPNGHALLVVLNWKTPTHHLNIADSSDGVHFTSAFGPGGSPQLSASAPDSLFAQREGGPEYWMAWTGTDPAHFLNVQWTTHYPQWPNPATTKTVLSDTALGGPQIVFNAGLLITWTGTDPAHHLNVAEFSGF